MNRDAFVNQLFIACVQSGEIESSTSPKTALQRVEKLMILYEHVKSEIAKSAPEPAVGQERIAPQL